MFCNIFTCFQILHKIWKFCTKFGHMILRKICKFVATGCQIVGLKYTKFDFDWGSAPDPAAWESLQHPRPSSSILGAYF